MTNKPSKDKASGARPRSGPGVFHVGNQSDELSALLSELEDLDLDGLDNDAPPTPAAAHEDAGDELELTDDDFVAAPPERAPAPARGGHPPAPISSEVEQGRRLFALQQELDEVKARAQKAAADFANYRKRLLKEKEEAVQFGNERMLRDLLPVLDNLQLALSHANESGFEQLVAGVRMTQSLMISTLGRHGLKPFDSTGDRFDPRRHQAMARVESADVEPGTVVSEGQRGYLLNERLLRAALVSVAVPSPDSPEAPADAASSAPKPAESEPKTAPEEEESAAEAGTSERHGGGAEADGWDLAEDIDGLFDEIARKIE